VGCLRWDAGAQKKNVGSVMYIGEVQKAESAVVIQGCAVVSGANALQNNQTFC
jgi:uncharacterized protein YvpB